MSDSIIINDSDIKDPTIKDSIKIVNARVLRRLSLGEANKELFSADVRTLAELIKIDLENRGEKL